MKDRDLLFFEGLKGGGAEHFAHVATQYPTDPGILPDLALGRKLRAYRYRSLLDSLLVQLALACPYRPHKNLIALQPFFHRRGVHKYRY